MLPLARPLFLLALLPACGTPGVELFETNRASSAREAGSVHVAVVAVAPWADYVDALQPQFQLSADQARELAMRDTRTMDEASLEAAQLAVSAVEDPDENRPVRAPDLTSVRYADGHVPRAEGRDAMLEFLNANALFQEVQILNRSLRDAPVPDGYRPYLVRLQITLMPRLRHQPYDAYTTLSFFTPDDAPHGDGARPEVLASAAGDEGPGSLAAASIPPTQLRGSEFSSASTKAPRVLPLLVTDNLESSLNSRSAESIRRLALSFLALPGSFASQLNADLFQNQMKAAVSGRDLNSLLTVASVSENSLRVRLGAAQGTRAEFAMVPRNHNVTVLLMVPEEAAGSIELVAKTALVDVDTGEEVVGATAAEVSALYDRLRADYGLGALDDATLEALFACAQANEAPRYFELLRGELGAGHPSLPYAQQLWIDLVSLMVGSQYASTRFDLPGHGIRDLVEDAFYEQTPILRDDGARGCQVTLAGVRFAESVEVSALLRVHLDDRVVALPADFIEHEGDSRRLHLGFPSLASIGIAGQAAAPGACVLSLRWSGDEQEFEVLYR